MPYKKTLEATAGATVPTCASSVASLVSRSARRIWSHSFAGRGVVFLAENVRLKTAVRLVQATVSAVLSLRIIPSLDEPGFV